MRSGENNSFDVAVEAYESDGSKEDCMDLQIQTHSDCITRDQYIIVIVPVVK